MNELSILAANNLKIIENYNDAVSATRALYFKKAQSQTINSLEQNETIDQLLVLDFMIESNQQILNYLNHFKKHQQALSTQALEDVLTTLTTEDHDNIHETIMKIKKSIASHSQQVSQKLKADYNFRARIYGPLAISLLVLPFSLGPILGIYGNAIELALIAAGLSAPAIIIATTLTVILVILLMFACQYQTNLYAQPGSFFYQSDYSLHSEGGRLVKCLEVQDSFSDPEDSTLFVKSYHFTTRTEHREHPSLTTTTTTLFQPQREQLISTLRKEFAGELAQEVEREYTTLNR